MSSTLFAESKLLFYPTSEYETIRMLAIVGGLDWNYRNGYFDQTKEFESFAPYSMVSKLVVENDLDRYSVYFDLMLRQGKYDYIKKHFQYNLNSSETSIVDLFCGEGDWLSVWKNFIPFRDEESKRKLWLIGNEIEEGRYEKAKKKVNHCYNSAFEEIDLPKQFAGIMLFNPPYSSSNGERNSKRYLRMMLEKDYIRRRGSGGYWNSGKGILITVLRKDDTLDCLDLLVKNFEILGTYKVNPEEYAKYKQFVLYANIREKPLDESSPADASTIMSEMREWQRVIESEPEFDISMYKTIKYGKSNYSSRFYPPTIDVRTVFQNHKVVQNRHNYLSKPNAKTWLWLKQQTTVEDAGLTKLTMPRAPKSSELANIIAAGYINSEITEEGKPHHIAIGGTKTLVKTEEMKYNDEDGEAKTKTVTTKTSVPYLNILYTQDGKIKLKELTHE